MNETFEPSDFTRRGFAVMPHVLDAEILGEFESAIDELGRAQAERRGISVGDEPLADLLRIGGAYRSLLFAHLKNLLVVQRMADRLVRALDSSGFSAWSGCRVPAIWPTLRADLPNEQTYLLPMHQDYGSTYCRRAWRFWVPLRAVDERHGTMRLVAGSHQLGVPAYDFSDPCHPRIPEAEWDGHPVEQFELPAGHGVLIDPRVFHESVPNRSDRLKFVLLLQIQDLATLGDPSDPADEMAEFFRLTQRRESARSRVGMVQSNAMGDAART